ncbi:MAG TPA: biotin/lipoyl-containing protein, partial [Vicinamibacteria bacterium]|nr:biotin/lipoyl-containing protein [Vicinamibacteria bacterium]
MTVSKVVLAKLSPTMEEGTIVKWTKKEGDAVKQGDVLAEIETDKANMEMEALGSGVLRKILVPAGGKAPIGALIGVIAEPNEDIEPLIAKEGAKAGGAPKPAAPAAPAPEPAKAAAEETAKAAPADQPASGASAGQTPPVPAAPAPTSAGPVGQSSPGAGGDGGRVKASPLARSMAAHQNIDLASVAGSGPGGRIIKRDIESWVGPRPGADAPARSVGAPASRPSAAPAFRPAAP